MSTLELVLLVCLGSSFAGLLGSLTGLGGGVVIVPLLVLAFGVDIRYAAGASLISVIATSSGAAAAYTEEGYSNIRIGMFLEMATTAGAIVGAFLAVRLATNILGVIFGVVLIVSALLSIRENQNSRALAGPIPWHRLRMDSTYPTAEGPRSYRVRHVPAGFGMMFGAGAISGLLGIWLGAFKVLAMDQVMRVPFKVSTTTSNFMIGVTAAASAGIYLRRGFITPGLAMPVVLGVLLGSVIGTFVLVRARTKWLRWVFSFVIMALGIEMIYGGLTGSSMKSTSHGSSPSPAHSSSPSPARSSAPKNIWTDHHVEVLIGNLLRTGVLLSGAIVLFGGILYLIQYGHVSAHYSGFNANRAELRAVGPVLRQRSTLIAAPLFKWACCCSLPRRWSEWHSPS